MFFDFQNLASKDHYKLLTATVVPRPIALVTTRNADGSANAAPFSFFNVFSDKPPLVVLGLQSGPDSELKDTTHNIRLTGEFVVNLVDEDVAEKMIVCAADFPRVKVKRLEKNRSEWVHSRTWFCGDINKLEHFWRFKLRRKCSNAGGCL